MTEIRVAFFSRNRAIIFSCWFLHSHPSLYLSLRRGISIGSIFIWYIFSFFFFNFPIYTCQSYPSFVFVCTEKDWLLVAAGGSCCDLAPPISYILILYYIFLHYILNHIYIRLCIKYSILIYSYLLVAGRSIMTDLADYHQHGVGSFFILKQKNQQCLLKILILILKAFSSCSWWFFGWKDWLGFTW